MDPVSIPRKEGGIYVLCIKNEQTTEIKVGKLGTLEFEKDGIHVYVGSAMNGLYHRIKRHLSKDKKIRWHIDYLLEKARVFKVCYAITNERKECAVSQFFNVKNKFFTPVPRFGNSDCRSCPGHLYKWIVPGKLEKFDGLVRTSFESAGLKPRILQNS